MEVSTSSGTVSGTDVKSGGTQYVSGNVAGNDPGGSAVSTTVEFGGTQELGSSGRTSHTSVFGQQFIHTGGIASGDTIGVGGEQFISSGGIASATTVSRPRSPSARPVPWSTAPSIRAAP